MRCCLGVLWRPQLSLFPSLSVAFKKATWSLLERHSSKRRVMKSFSALLLLLLLLQQLASLYYVKALEVRRADEQLDFDLGLDSNSDKIDQYYQKGEGSEAHQADLNVDPQILESSEESEVGSFWKRSETPFKNLMVSVPSYSRLMSQQRSALKLDALMRRMAEELPTNDLVRSSQWHRLLALRRSLQALMPEDHPDFDWSPVAKRSLDMNFNGIQVSLPQYMRLSAMQRKVARLDALMQRIRSSTPQQELESIPAWRKLVSLRKSLIRLLPMPSQ